MSAKGDVIDPCDHIAQTLIKRQLAELVEQDKPKNKKKVKE